MKPACFLRTPSARSLAVAFVTGIPLVACAPSGSDVTECSCAGFPSDGQEEYSADHPGIVISKPTVASTFLLTIGTKVGTDRRVAEQTNLAQVSDLATAAARITLQNSASGYVLIQDLTVSLPALVLGEPPKTTALIRRWVIAIGDAAVARSDGRAWTQVLKP